jgi:beta-glucosidase
MRNSIFALVCAFSLCAGGVRGQEKAAAQEKAPAYKDAKLAIEDRVADLVPRMTLDEKIEEIAGGRHYETLDRTGKFNGEAGKKAFSDLGKLENTVSPRDRAILHNAAQRYLLEKSRLGIPALFFGEALHGFMGYRATSFPIPLGLASTWDPELVEKVFTVAGDEAAATGVNDVFTPVLDLGRDPRWGRTEETYGEDPFLVSRMGVAAIDGLQGKNFLIDRHHVVATMKHFAAHGQPESGTNTAPANFSERFLRETFLVPFKAAVQEAHVGSVMASYNEIDGVPSHINPWLLDKLLRQEWGFRGYVVSDGGGLQMLFRTHHVAEDAAEAARKALPAGVDFDLSDGSVYRTLTDQVKAGTVPESLVDRAVSRVLATKFRLGLFENPYVDPDYAERNTNNAEHIKLALKTAQEAIILLKNENNLLPLDETKIKTIAVIGPNAAEIHQGGYSRDPGRGVSLLEGIRVRAGKNINVLYSEGCKITEGTSGWAGWYANNPKLPDPQKQMEEITAAVETAKKADVAILVVGENEHTNREAWSEEHRGDRDSLDLFGDQDKLVKAVVETGVPTVVFLIGGRPLSINYAAEKVPAILEGWYLGQEGGTAAAQVLFGDVNPSGKLPITFPRSVGQLPDYYDHKPSMNRNYAFTTREPLFPFGFGLSYTTFKFENLRVEPAQIGPDQTATVHVDVTNIGARDGDEVAELYIHQRVSSVTQPVLTLKGFRRVHLKAGEKQSVEFTLTPEALSILDIHMDRVVEPEVFDVMVGGSSVEMEKGTLEVKK